MLQKFQNILTGWMLWVLVVIISLGFMLWGVENYFQQGPSNQNKSLGTINGADVYPSEVEREFRNIASRLAAQNNNKLPASVKPVIEKQAFNVVLVNKLIQTRAPKIGYAFSDDILAAEIPKFPIFRENGQFSESRFQQMIMNLGYRSEQDFLNNIKTARIIGQIQAGIVGSELITESEFAYWARIIEQTRTFNYIDLPISHYTKSAKVSDDEIQSFYGDNKARFQQEEQIKLKYVELSDAAIRNNIEISDEDIQDYYKENQNRFISPRKWRVAHIWIKKEDKKDINSLVDKITKEIKEGKDFSVLAKKYSDDKLTSEKGGELYWLTEGAVDDDYLAPIKELSKPGEVTSPIKSDDGIEIFKLLEIKEESTKELSDVKADIRSRLASNEANKRFATLVDDLADISYSNSESLEEVSKQLQLPIKETEFFSRGQGTNDPIAKFSNVVEAAFHEDVYENGNNSLPIRIANNRAVVIRISEKQPARIRELSEVKDDIKEALILRKSAEKVADLVKDIVSKLEEGKSIKATLKKEKLEWKSKKNVLRSDKEISANLAEIAFSTTNPSNESKIYPNGLISQEDYVIVDVQNITYPDLSKLSDDQKTNVSNYIKNYYSNMMYSLYISDLKEKSEIKLSGQDKED